MTSAPHLALRIKARRFGLIHPTRGGQQSGIWYTGDRWCGSPLAPQRICGHSRYRLYLVPTQNVIIHTRWPSLWVWPAQCLSGTLLGRRPCQNKTSWVHLHWWVGGQFNCDVELGIRTWESIFIQLLPSSVNKTVPCCSVLRVFYWSKPHFDDCDMGCFISPVIALMNWKRRQRLVWNSGSSGNSNCRANVHVQPLGSNEINITSRVLIIIVERSCWHWEEGPGRCGTEAGRRSEKEEDVPQIKFHSLSEQSSWILKKKETINAQKKKPRKFPCPLISWPLLLSPSPPPPPLPIDTTGSRPVNNDIDEVVIWTAVYVNTTPTINCHPLYTRSLVTRLGRKGSVSE